MCIGVCSFPNFDIDPVSAWVMAQGHMVWSFTCHIYFCACGACNDAVINELQICSQEKRRLGVVCWLRCDTESNVTLQVIIHVVERRTPCLHMSGMFHIRLWMWVSAVALVSVKHTALLEFIISDQASELSHFCHGFCQFFSDYHCFLCFLNY